MGGWMQPTRLTTSFAAGLAAGAILVLSAPLAASDPPPATQEAHGGQGDHAGHDQHGAQDASHRPEHASGHDAVPGPDIAFRGCAYFEDAGFAGRRVDV